MTTTERRSGWRDAVVIAAAIEAFAVAAWLLPASVHIVRWAPTGPARLALLAPSWQLLAYLAVGLVVCAGLLAWPRFRPGGRAGDVAQESRLHRLRAFAAPFLLLWLWLIPYLPWIGDWLPLLLALAGPLRWAILGAAVATSVGQAGSGDWLLKIAGGVNGRVVLAASFAVYLVLGQHSVGTVGLGGDEPHYLIITESLLRDGDLQIENNHRQRDYRSFYPRELRPDFMQRGQNGAIYSIHAPGLAALLLPVYALTGYRGAVGVICLLAALAALAIFTLADAVAGRLAAVLTWLGVCFTVPFIPYSWSIFPEMAGAVAVAWAAVWVWRPVPPSLITWLGRGVVLAALPWLHTKFALFFAIFGAALFLRLWRRPGAVAAFLAPMAVSGVLWLYSFYAIYGVPDPEAPYGGYTGNYVLTRYIPHGLVGILFDQKFGLLVYSPVYLLVAAGAWQLWRRRETRYLAGTLMVATAIFVISSARLYMFWGGSSAPARFLVPILPCLAPMVAAAIASVRGPAGRALVGVWMAISLGVALLGAGWPARLMLFSDPHGRARLLEAIQAGSPLALVAPTFTEPGWAADLGPLALWLAAAVAALAAAAIMSRWRTGPSAWRVAAVASATFGLAAAVLTARPNAAVREATARRGALNVLRQFDGHRVRTFDYGALGRATPDRLRELTTVVFRGGAVAEGDVVAGPIDLPPGSYQAVIWFAGARPRAGEVVVSSSPRATFAELTGPLANPTTVPFDLPVDVRRLTVGVRDRQAASGIAEVHIVPVSVPPPSERPPFRARAIESLPGRNRAYVVYANDDAYPEGGVFWTRGTAAAEIVVAPAGAPRMTLTLATGPMSGPVTVTTGAETRQVDMLADQPLTIAVDLPRGEPLVPVVIQSSVMFRPGEVDKSSGDMRGLGCHVRIAFDQ